MSRRLGLRHLTIMPLWHPNILGFMGDLPLCFIEASSPKVMFGTVNARSNLHIDFSVHPLIYVRSRCAYIHARPTAPPPYVYKKSIPEPESDVLIYRKYERRETKSEKPKSDNIYNKSRLHPHPHPYIPERIHACVRADKIHIDSDSDDDSGRSGGGKEVVRRDGRDLRYINRGRQKETEEVNRDIESEKRKVKKSLNHGPRTETKTKTG